MSGKKEPTGRDDWIALQESHWQTTRATRNEEDAKLNHEYALQQDKCRHTLVDLYDKRAQLHNQVHAIEASIKYEEKEQERLSHEYEATRARLLAMRQEEDRSQQEWFARARDNEIAAKENTQPKANGHPFNRDMPPPTPGSGGWTSINGARRRGRREDEEPPADPSNLLSSIYHNPVDEQDSPTSRAMPLRHSTTRSRPGTSSNGSTTEMDTSTPEAYATNRARDRPLKPKQQQQQQQQQRHSLPSFSAVIRSPATKPLLPENSLETKARSPSGRKSLPSAKGSAPTAASPIPEANTSDGKEITRENLIIKDNGSVVTEPAMYAGVPLERIDENHPYWNPEWESLEGIIQPQLDKWKEKLEQLRRTPEAVRHTVFLANRQVNRGQSVIDFLRDESFHPYQFVSKELMGKFYKTFINYDTMFRLVNVHEELKKFDLEVTPLEWLRQRMYEIAMVQGDKFSLSKTTHDLYHDAKLKYLREKHGFGNIGRPSGYKVGEKDPAKAAAKKAKKESSGSGGTIRRKGRRSIGQVDADDAPPNLEELQQQQQQQQKQGVQGAPTEYFEPVTPRLQKRQRLEPAPPKQEPEDDLEYEGYTSTDSFSAGRIMHLDWRVYQIKTRTLTTSTEVTQYWTWKQDKNLFEHQVLRDVYPNVTWGFYQKPINFDLTVQEVKEIQYALDSQKIHAVIDDEKRGNVLACFKRERTKKRFLQFAKKKGIKLVKTSHAHLEDVWNNMKSDAMPDGESEA
ncbi:hypothetical protein F5X96DRAFT_681654 [Biscogniauxia mediterranea]|nr:hypothetical protein F5X96DRAFT_681654 [Biscogniauxia mediterranea]